MQVGTCLLLLSTDWQLDVNEAYQPLEILFMQLYIIVSSTINPQRLNGPRTTLVDHLTMGEVDNFVVSSMDHKDHRCNTRYFVDATNLNREVTMGKIHTSHK